MSFDPAREDAEYHFYAKYDYLQEAYGAEARQLDEQNARERQCFACGEYIQEPDVACGAEKCVREHEDWQRGQDELAAEEATERAIAASGDPTGYLSPSSPYYRDALRVREAEADAELAAAELDAANPECGACDGETVFLGQLGRRAHYRCRRCGAESSREELDLDGGCPF